MLFDGRVVSKYEYEYDNNGNITSIKQDGKEAHRYKYDKKNQLTEEYDCVNNYYINYSLDGNGNIHSFNTQALDSDKHPTGSVHGNVYYYEDKQWCDKLTRVNNTGYITYDEIGNPLNYRDGMSFTWRNGRWLSTTTLNDGTKVTYRYNANGMRTQKKVGSKVTDYYYDSNNNLIAQKTDNATLFFYYDTENSPVALSYNGKMFYYVKNLQGDIVKILDEDGNEKASYVYNAWGDILSQSEDELASINPLRYRGYVYDEDTTLYYLQTRYYDPTTGRFINADDTAYIGATGTVLSANIFTYCENNAIMFTDYNGQLLKEEKEAGRKFWKNWVVSTLKKKKWTYSATFLEHSLRDKPSNLWYNSYTALSKKIKKTNEFKNLVKKVRKKHKNKWVSNYTCSLVYNSGDLLGAFHNISVTVNEMWINGCRYFQFLLEDKYDFKLENYSGNWAIKVGNNMALADQNQGIIVPYKIYVIVYAKR